MRPPKMVVLEVYNNAFDQILFSYHFNSSNAVYQFVKKLRELL